MIASSKGWWDVLLWDVRTGDCKGTLDFRTYSSIYNMAFSPNGNLFVSSFDTTVNIWEIVPQMRRRHTMDHHERVSDLVFSPQGHQLASASHDNQVRLWDVETGVCQMILIGHIEGAIFITYSLDGSILVSAGGSIVRVWDVASGTCRAVAHDTPYFVSGITRGVASEDIYVVTRSDDGSTMVWKVDIDDNNCQLNMKWFATSGALVVKGSTIQGVHGLSQLNKKLLKQRGAQGEPVYHLREASNKVVAMASVVSRLWHAAGRTPLDTSSNAGQLGDREESHVEQLASS
jgi:WD40 repeat protein